MKKIVAIGGGEIGRPGYPVETAAIDKEIIRLSGKRNPTLLFLDAANPYAELYRKVVQKHFGKRLGCKVENLDLKDKPTLREIEEKILKADIVYVGGGNTLKIMKIWRKAGVDRVLRRAYEKGVVLSGLSAGAICWFRYGHSDSKKFFRNGHKNTSWMKVSGLGLKNVVLCPHYNDKGRAMGLKEMMKKTPGVAIALENCCAIEIVDNDYRIITSKKGARAYKVFWSKGEYRQEVLEKSNDFRSLKDLLEQR